MITKSPFSTYWPPVFVSQVEGIRSADNGKRLRGYLLAAPLTTKQIIFGKSLAALLLSAVQCTLWLGIERFLSRAIHHIGDPG